MTETRQDIGPSDADEIRSALAEGDGVIRNAHFAGAGGSEVVQRRTALIDRTLRDLASLHAVGRDLPALVAVGGYGRGELNPRSDIDILFLCSRDADRDRASPLLYSLWDAGLDIGYSVRTAQECVELARDDSKIRTSLLESRLISGDPSLYHSFEQLMHAEVFFHRPGRFIEEKLGERNAARQKYGGSLYLREPNIKESAGGLRDFHTARWIAFTRFRTFSLSELVSRGNITAGRLASFLRSRGFLWRIRNELHYLSGRKSDHLTFDLQETAARDFRFRDSADLLAVERLMKTYFLHARNVLEFSRLMTEQALPGRKLFRFEARRAIGPFVLAGRSLAPLDADRIRREPERLLEAFALFQDRSAAFSDRLSVLVRATRFGDDLRGSPAAAKAFLAILDNPVRLADTLTLMRDLTFLGRYLPEFRAVQALARHDYHHTFTVDEHILTAVRRLEDLWQGRFPALTTLSQAMRELRSRWRLFLAVLLHDLGKISRDRHEVRGREIAEGVLARLGIGGEDHDRILFLVERHLVMASLSQRRELSDRKVVADFARLAGDRENLNLLYLLTYADLSAVSPAAWSPWKASLLQDLYLRTADFFARADREEDQWRGAGEAARRLADAAQGRATEEEIRSFTASLPNAYLRSASLDRMLEHLEMVRRLPEEQLIVSRRHRPDRGYTDLTVCAYDAYGMFFRTAGAIAAQRMNILRAQVFTTRNGIMIDTFQITDADGQPAADEALWETLIGSLRDLLSGARTPAASAPSPYAPRSHGTVPPSVEFDNETSEEFTIIDVTARDRVGLLFRISRTLFDLNLDIGSAKIVTEGIRAMDAFYVTDLFRQKILDPARLEKIRAALLEALR